ncbi:hypothetical protein Hypma_003061 [Hypsizygus marmoreus]|uniref:Nephrocystin 3-like N-terminal domain-containing protein n=1 Tax=Hypsizygus marmoreus TaxID=39966 RepID=A0A369JBN5_HYPMA|nr:hypothetical protein Hypma_003061 [Hypsizygus marmoreus]
MSFANSENTNILNSTFIDVRGDFVRHETRENLTGLRLLYKAISTGASYNSQERYPFPTCHPGTRTTVLNDIWQWINDGSTTRDGSILWLYGPAGAGKSAIAQKVSDDCAERGMLAASFFFSRDATDRGTIKNLYTTLAYQLAMSIPEKKFQIAQVVEDNPAILQSIFFVQLNELILRPLQSGALHDADTSYSPSIVVIDGLDECNGNGEQSRIVDDVVFLVDKNCLPLRFILTSRPEPHLTAAFRSHHTREMSLYWTPEADNDITNYLRHGFDNIHNSERHSATKQQRQESKQEPWPLSDWTVRRLALNSSGYFIYASTILKFVDEEYFDPHERLQVILGSAESPSNSATPFAELDNLYRQILARCRHSDRLHRILGYLIFSPFGYFDSGIPVSLIDAILGLGPGDTLLTIRGLHSLIQLVESPAFADGPAIRYLHASFPDFLLDQARSGQFFLDTEACNADITRAHLNFIGGGKWKLFNLDVTVDILKILSHDFRPGREEDKREVMKELQDSNMRITWKPLILDSKNWQSLRGRTALTDIFCNIPDMLRGVPSYDSGIDSPTRDLVESFKHLLDFTFLTQLSGPPDDGDNILFVQGVFTVFDFFWSTVEGFLKTSIAIAKLLQLTFQPHWTMVYAQLMGLLGHNLSNQTGFPTYEHISPKKGPFARFMYSPKRSEAFFQWPQARHARLADCCMRLLSEPLRLNYYSRPEIAYARMYWVHHLVCTDPGDEKNLTHLQRMDMSVFWGEVCFAKELQFQGPLYLRPQLMPQLMPELMPEPSPLSRAAEIAHFFYPSYSIVNGDQSSYRYMFNFMDVQNAKLVVEWLKRSPHPIHDILWRWQIFLRDGLCAFGIKIA